MWWAGRHVVNTGERHRARARYNVSLNKMLTGRLSCMWVTYSVSTVCGRQAGDRDETAWLLTCGAKRKNRRKTDDRYMHKQDEDEEREKRTPALERAIKASNLQLTASTIDVRFTDSSAPSIVDLLSLIVSWIQLRNPIVLYNIRFTTS